MSQPWEDFDQGATTASAPSPDEGPWNDFSDKLTVEPNPYEKAKLKYPETRGVFDNSDDLLRAVVNDPKSIPKIAAGLGMSPFDLAGKIANAAAQDAGAVIGANPEGFGNVEQVLSQTPVDTTPLPSEKTLADISKEHPVIATAGKVASGLTEAAPMMAAGIPAGAFGRLVSLGFSADMLKAGSDAATQLGEEMGKNPEDRDADKVTSAVSSLIQSGAFAPLAGAHGLKPGVTGELALQLLKDPKVYPMEKPSAPVVETVSQNPWDDFKQPETPAAANVPKSSSPVLDMPAMESEIAKRVQENGFVASGDFTIEGIKKAMGLPEEKQGDATRIAPMVDAGLIERTPEGNYRFNENIQKLGTLKNISKTPDPNWRVTVQPDEEISPGNVMPGYVQIDDVTGGQNKWSSSPETLAKQGITVPDFSKLPKGRYTFSEAEQLLEKQKSSPPPEEPITAPTPPPAESAAPTSTPPAEGEKLPELMTPKEFNAANLPMSSESYLADAVSSGRPVNAEMAEYTGVEKQLLETGYIKSGDAYVKPILAHGDEVHATMPDGKEVKGHIIGADDAGNAVLLQQNGKSITLPEKLTEVQNANPEQKPVEVLRNPSPRTAEEVAGGSPSDVQQIAEPRPSEEAGLPQEVAKTRIQDAANALADRLERLKSGISNGGQLHAFGVAADLWDRAVGVAQAIIRAGGTAAEAIQAAIDHIRSNHQGDFDHNGATKAFTDALTAEEAPKAQGQSETFGIAQRVREARAEAGQSVPVPTGEGIAPEASVGRGRQLLMQGADPEKALADFESTKRFSSDDIALVRARGEQLAQMAKEAEQKFGTDSNEYGIAWHLLADWDTRSKAMQTEWHKSGQAQQGETDIDTGTFTGLQRAYRDTSGKDFTPEQADAAKVIAEKGKNAEVETEQAKQKLFDNLDEETKAKTAPKKEEQVEPHVRLIADKLKGYFEGRAKSALERIKARRAEGRLFTGIDPSDLADYADYGASKILQKGLEVEKMSEEWAKEMVSEIGDYIKPHLETIWKASQKVFYDGFKKNIGLGEQASKVKKVLKSDAKDVEVNANKKALEAAQIRVREAAVKVADAEAKARVSAAKAKKDVAEVQKQAAQKALEAATKRAREAATKLAESENKRRLKQAAIDSFGEPGSLDEVRKMISYRKPGQPFTPDQVRAIWSYAKRTYIEKGITNFDDIRNKLATDLGIPVSEVTQALAQPKGAKRLTDELWKKQQAARRVQQQAREFIRSADMPGYIKALSSIPKILFGLKVGFHGTVALGTHAPFVAFQPNFWKIYFQDFAKMYKMVGSPAFYEKEAQDLFRRPNFTLATRAGLVNDPFKVEDFNNPALSQYLGAMTGMGNRGYFVLKILRQDMFDQMWNQLPETTKVPDVAKAIADGINHATGVIKGSAPQASNLLLFAPRLEFSRVAWLAVDPVKGLMTVANWNKATPAERIFAVNQFKEKAWVAGTLFGLLAFNAGILQATGSKQQINFSDPMKSDFLKFKGDGMVFSYGNAMLSMARLPVRLYQIRSSDGGKLKNLIYPDEDTYSVLGEYARSQLSPFASLISTLWFKSDWQNRPLPNSQRPVPKRLAQHGVGAYTWPEFWAEQVLPIPLEEAAREVWQHGLGMNPDQAAAMRKAMATIAVMSATGGRLTEDTDLNKKSQLPQ